MLNSLVMARPSIDMQVDACVTFGSVDAVFKALADPTRRTILDELTERNGQTLFEICSRLATKHGLGSSRQAISHSTFSRLQVWSRPVARAVQVPLHQHRAARTDRRAVARKAGKLTVASVPAGGVP